jgi:hypothetical protein
VGKGTISIYQIVETLPLVWEMTTVTARREIADWGVQRYAMINPFFFWGGAWSQLIDVVFFCSLVRFFIFSMFMIARFFVTQLFIFGVAIGMSR